MKSLNIVIGCALFLLVSCNKVEDQSVLLGGTDEEIPLSAVFESCEVIPLQEHANCMLGDVSRIKYDGSRYFMLDTEGQRIISYGEDGAYLHSYQKMGKGKDEYLHISDFDVDGEFIYILAFPYKIYKLDKDLTLSEIITLGDSYCNICCQEGKIYLYSDHNNQVCSLTSEGTQKVLHEGRVLRACPKSNLPAFHKMDNRLFFVADGGDVIYQIIGDALTPWLKIDYKNKENVLKRYSQENILSFKERLEYSHPAIHSIMRLKDTILLLYVYGHVYRLAKLDLSNRLISDGVVIGSPLPMSQSSNRILSVSYCDDETLNSLGLKKNSGYDARIPEAGCMTVIKYYE